MTHKQAFGVAIGRGALATLLFASTALAEPLLAPEVPSGVTAVSEFPGKLGNAVNEGKAQFLALLTPLNIGRFGFDTKPKPPEIKLLEGLPESVVSAGEVRAFNPNANVNTKHWEVDRIVYPVVIGGKVRSAITTALVGGKWKPVAYGQVPLVRTVMAAKFKALNAPELKGQPLQYRIVTIFGLNEQFVGAFPLDPAKPFWLIPIRTRNGLVAGVPAEGKSVLLKLQPAALALTGSGPT
jgi:hypothetical protein